MRTTTTIICSHPESELNQPLRIEITADHRSGFFQTNARVCGVERGSREEEVIDTLCALLLSLAMNGVEIGTDAVGKATSEALHGMLALLHPHPADVAVLADAAEDAHGLP